ncbi:hypothetical protein D9M72_558950 [compost metagenome]
MQMVDGELAGRGEDALHLHTVLGKGAGLVSEDECGGPERLHCRQVLNERVATGHAQHAAGEGQRRDNRQTFRDCCHRECDRRLCHQEDRLAGIDSSRGDDGGERKRQPDELMGEVRKLPLEW